MTWRINHKLLEDVSLAPHATKRGRSSQVSFINSALWAVPIPEQPDSSSSMLATTLSSASGGEDVCIMRRENRLVKTYVVIILRHYICDSSVSFQPSSHPLAHGSLAKTVSQLARFDHCDDGLARRLSTGCFTAPILKTKTEGFC